jgi:putative ABC transport system permease protein
MLNLIRLALKNVRENRVRTLLTVIGTAVAIFIFCFFQSISAKMNRIVSEAGNKNNLVVSEKNKWCPSQSFLPDNYVGKIAELPQVEAAMPDLLASTAP